jgi:hypothetical protein
MMTHGEERPSKQRNNVDKRIDALRACYPDFYKENWQGIWGIEAAMGDANDEPINDIRDQCLLELCSRLEAKQNPDQIDLSLVKGGRAHKAIREAARFPDAFLERSLSSIREGCEMPDGVKSETVVASDITGDNLASSHRDRADSMSLDRSHTIPVSEIPGQAASGTGTSPTPSEATFSDDGSQLEERPLPSDVPGRPGNQDESTKAKRELQIERCGLRPRRKISELKIVNAIDIARDSRLSDDQTISPISDLGIVVDPEVSGGADPATVSARIHDSAPPGATTPTCETPISPSSSLHGFNFDMPRPAEASDSRNALSDFNFDFDLGSIPPPTSQAVQSPVLVHPTSTAKVKEASYNLEALDGISMPKTETEPSSTVISPSTPVYTRALLDSPDTDQQPLSDRPELSSVSDVSTTAEIDLGTGRLGPTSKKKRAKLGVALNRFSSRFLSGRPRYSRPGPRRTMTIENLDHNIRKTAARLQGHTRLPACVDEHAFSGPTSRNEASFSTETETSSSGKIDEPASSMKSLSVSDADQRTSLADISATTSILPEDRHKPPNSKRRGRFRKIIASGPERRRRRFGAMLRRKKPPRNDA